MINICGKNYNFQAYLLPDKSKNGKRKTKVRKNNLSPVFSETLKYYIPLSHLDSRTIWLSVWHSDVFGKNDFLGEVNIELGGRLFDDPRPRWHTLQERVRALLHIYSATYGYYVFQARTYADPMNACEEIKVF